MGKLFYLMGKSASGKDTMFDRLCLDQELQLKPLVIYTTRPMRSGEIQGAEYHFVSEKEYETLRDEGRVLEMREYLTVKGPWKYFTVDDGTLDSPDEDFLGIGTLVSFQKIRDYYGKDRVIPLYIETEDGLRLQRALSRARQEEHPDYKEMCRRFLADTEDFSDENLRAAGVDEIIRNEGEPEDCFRKLRSRICSEQEKHKTRAVKQEKRVISADGKKEGN